MIYSEDYRHPLEGSVRVELERILAFEGLFLSYYEEVVVPQKRMDCLGKTVLVTAEQFPQVFALVAKLSQLLDIPEPPLYVYEDFYYEADVQGCQRPWLEISSKTIKDFTLAELTFIIGRQLAQIKLGHLQTRVCINLFNEFAQGRMGSVLGGVTLGLSSTMLTTLTLSANKWLRVINISMDCAGFLLVGNIQTAARAIMLEVLNNRELAASMSVPAFLKQAAQMDAARDVFSLLAHYEQRVPYAPYRIKELLRFASSDRAKKYGALRRTHCFT
jgi:hypothetical protein